MIDLTYTNIHIIDKIINQRYILIETKAFGGSSPNAFFFESIVMYPFKAVN